MRILHINDHCTHVGGIENYIADVNRLLKSKGHSSHLMCFRGQSEKYLIPDTFSISVQQARHLDSGTLAILNSSLVKYQPDVAFVHGVANPGIIEWVARNVPTLAYVHSLYLVCPGYARYLRKSRTSCHHRVGAICIVNAQKERCCYGRNPKTHWEKLRWVQRLINVYKNLTIMVGSEFMGDLLRLNGVSRNGIYTLPPVFFSSEIPTYHPPPDHKTILFVGRLIPEKGFDILIEELKKISSEWKLLVAGEAEKNGEYRKLVANLGLASQITFLDHQSESQIDKLYRQCSFVVIPSIGPESYGRVGPEAFRRGRPAIAFAVGGIPEWLDDGVNGLIAEEGDTEKLGRLINHLINNPEEQLRLGLAAFNKAKSFWQADAHAERLIEAMTLATQKFSPHSLISH